jgi:hypothetical protein
LAAVRLSHRGLQHRRQKLCVCRDFKPSDRPEPSTLLIMCSNRQPVVTHGNGVAQLRRFGRHATCHRLPPVGTTGLQKCSRPRAGIASCLRARRPRSERGLLLAYLSTRAAQAPAANQPVLSLDGDLYGGVRRARAVFLGGVTRSPGCRRPGSRTRAVQAAEARTGARRLSCKPHHGPRPAGPVRTRSRCCCRPCR